METQTSEKQLLSKYLEDSEKTLSGKFFYDDKNTNEPDVYHFSKLAIKATEDLDLIKKKKYYGKAIDISSSMPSNLEFNRDNKGENLLHAAIGVVTESGELLDTILKYKYGEKELDVVNIKEEIGDLMWYLAILLRDLNIDLHDAMDVNILKLKARYGEKFSSEKAINRKLDVERTILEDGVIIEDRNLSTGGMKPPKVTWESYAQTIDITNAEKQKLKREMAMKLGLIPKEEEVINKGGLKLEDIADSFKFLEVYDGSLIIKLITNRKEVEDLKRNTKIDLSKFKDEITKAETIALSFYDVLSMKNLGVARFAALISFDQMSGILKLKKLLGPSNEEIVLSHGQQKEFDNFLSRNNIEK